MPHSRPFAVAVLVSLALTSLASQPLERRLYVANDRGGVSVYHIDQDHKLLRTIPIANPHDGKAARDRLQCWQGSAGGTPVSLHS